MAVLMFWYLLCSLLAAVLASPMPQAPNTMAFLDLKAMSWSDNGSMSTKMPVGTSISTDRTHSYLHHPDRPNKGPISREIPTSYSAKRYLDLPMGFPAGKHPVVCRIEYENQIRLFDLSIECLLGAMCSVPWVQRLAGSTIPFSYPLINLLAGCSSDDVLAKFLEAIVPGKIGVSCGYDI